MPKIIPEKMVEIWTSRALFQAFGSSTRLWAPTRGFDQMAAPDRTKRFLLELKAPDWSTPNGHTTRIPQANPPAGPRPVIIDVGQLLEYHETLGSEVLYVLPQPAHYWPPGGIMELDGDHVRSTFPDWAYLICSSQLLKLINDNGRNPDLKRMTSRQLGVPWAVTPADRGSNGRYERQIPARVVCTHSGQGTEVRRWQRGPLGRGIGVVPFGMFLALLKLCVFGPPLVIRSRGLPQSRLTIRQLPEGLVPVDVEIEGGPTVDEPPLDDLADPAGFPDGPRRLFAVEVSM